MAEQNESTQADRSAAWRPEPKSVADWAVRANKVSENISLFRSTAMEALSGFAIELADETGQREARGQEESIASGAPKAEQDAWAIQMTLLAKQSMALANDLGPNGPSVVLGSFSAIYAQLPRAQKEEVLNFGGASSLPDARWDAAIKALAKQDGIVVALSKTPTSRSMDSQAEEFGKAFLDQATWSQKVALKSELTQPAPASPEGLLQARIENIASMRGGLAQRAVATGSAWTGEGMTDFTSKNLEATLLSLGHGLVDLANRSGIDPKSDTALGASVVALASMMGPTVGKSFIAGISHRGSTPEVDQAWRDAVAPALAKAQSKWGAGEVVPATSKIAPLALGSMIPSIFGKIANGIVSGLTKLSEAGLDPLPEEAPHTQAAKVVQEPAKPVDYYETSRKAGVAVGRVLSGFANTFSPSALKSSFAAFADKANAAAEGFQAKLSTGAAALVDQANHATNTAEARFKDSLKSGLRSGAAAIDGVVKLAHTKASQTRDGFVGKVGEAKRSSLEALGSVALKAKDALPSAEALKGGSGKPGQTAMIQIATMAGALFVGVAMAPVAGVLAAGVGALAAGVGLSSGLTKAIDVARAKASSVPDALEGLAQKLGAKRSARPDRVEPVMAHTGSGSLNI